MGIAPTMGGSASVNAMSLSYIRPRHTEIARRLVLGQTQAEICRALDMSASRMSIIVNSPLFKLKLNQLEKERDQSTVDVAKQIRETAPDALDQITRIMYKSSDEDLRFKAAQDLLDRGGFGKITKIDSRNTNVTVSADLSKDDMKELLLRRLGKLDTDLVKEEQELIEAESAVVEFDVIDNPVPNANSKKDELLSILEGMVA